MSIGYWERVQKAGFEVPSDRPLDELTAELTAMLGSTRPEVRDGTAFPALATWIANGVYDDLLAGLGDGMVAGLSVGVGEDGTDSVFRRSFSALILGACIERDNQRHLLPGAKILEWADRAMTWFLTERDTSIDFPWNAYGSIAYFAVISLIIFGLGVFFTKKRDA